MERTRWRPSWTLGGIKSRPQGNDGTHQNTSAEAFKRHAAHVSSKMLQAIEPRLACLVPVAVELLGEDSR